MILSDHATDPIFISGTKAINYMQFKLFKAMIKIVGFIIKFLPVRNEQIITNCILHLVHLLPVAEGAAQLRGGHRADEVHAALAVLRQPSILIS